MSRRSNRLAVFLIVAIAAVMNGCSSSSSPPISVSVAAHAPAIDQSQTDSITATVASDSSGVSWSLTGPGSLSATTGTTIAYNSPSTALTSPQQVTVTATSVTDKTKSAAVQITVNPYPQIPFQTLNDGFVGTPYSQTIMLTGGTPPFQWSVYNGPIITGNYVGGTVPDGLALNAGTGVVSGTPTGGGTWYFEATMTDAAGVTVINGFLNIEIDANTPVSNPIPFLNQPLVPTAVSPGSGAFTLNVSGAGFVSGAAVNFNGSPLTTTFVDDEHLKAAVPAANVAAAGTAAVSVVNPTPGGGLSNFVYFQVGAPSATVHFTNAANSPLPIYGSIAVAASDFNEDGKPDLAIAAAVWVNVMLGNGDGTFTAAPGSPVPLPSPPYDDFGSPYGGPALAVGDFNNTGHAGVVVGMFNNIAASVFFGNGNGTLTAAPTLANTFGESTAAIGSADFNRDGFLDMVAINGGGGVTFSPLLGYGHGAFNAVNENVQINGDSAAIGDFNGDGKLDVAIGNSIAVGNGDGTFTQGAMLSANGFSVAADFNGDGKLDLAVCDGPNNNVAIFLGDGAGNFAAAPNSPVSVGAQPDAIVAGDFNNDGKLDLAVANASDNTITVLLGNGDGTFTQASGSPYPVGKFPFSIAAADFNGDGKLDLAVANLSDGTVSILMQQ